MTTLYSMRRAGASFQIMMAQGRGAPPLMAFGGNTAFVEGCRCTRELGEEMASTPTSRASDTVGRMLRGCGWCHRASQQGLDPRAGEHIYARHSDMGKPRHGRGER